MRKTLAAVAMAVLMGTTVGYAQHWVIGANVGVSVVDGSAGFHLTPVAEYLFNQSIGVGSEFSVNTQYTSPLLWHPYFKYYFDIGGSRLRPYAKAGPVLALKVPNAPCFGVLFGGGINIPIAGRVSLTPDFMLGPIYGVGGGSVVVWFANIYGTGVYNAIPYTFAPVTIFVYSIRAGVRYEL